MKIIKNAMDVPCNMLVFLEFMFKLLAPAAFHNLAIIENSNDLGIALKANKHSPLGDGLEF